MRVPPKVSLVIGAIALVTVFGYFISRLLFFKQIFFEHAGIQLTQPEVAAAADHASDSAVARIQHVPKIIHQIFHNWHQPGNDTLPAHWAAVRQECVDLNPDFEFRVRRRPSFALCPLFVSVANQLLTAASLQLWTEKASRDFIETEYPWFLRAYDRYRYPVQRVDAVRYFLMLHYGGIYMDLDNVGGDPRPDIASHPTTPDC